MESTKSLRLSLLLMRVTVFLVMLMWTIDKFVRPDHASNVYETFYLLPGLAAFVMYGLGAIELIIIFGFVAGYKKTWTYGLVLVFHAISTLTSFPVYLNPFAEGPNLLFFAAWPMLAACAALFLLRDEDRWLTIS